MRFTNREPACEPEPTIQERVRRLPEALLLTAGYFASQVPGVGELIRRFG